MWSNREAEQYAKAAKILMHYMMYFGKMRNCYYRVMVSNGQMGKDEATVFVTLQTARPMRQDKTPLESDLHKFCSMAELCPDMIIIDKRTDQYGVVTYKLQQINIDLPWIKSEFFK